MAFVALEDGKLYVEATRNVINGETTAERRKEITAFFRQLLKNAPSIDVPTIDGDVLTITKAETAEKARDNYKYVDGKRVKMSDEEFLVKLHAESHIDEISEISKKSNSKADSKTHSFTGDGFSYRSAYFRDFDGKYYEITLSIGHDGTVATEGSLRFRLRKWTATVLPHRGNSERRLISRRQALFCKTVEC